MLPLPRPVGSAGRNVSSQRRSLWWCTRRANDWTQHFDEAFEKQFRRQQRLLQYRYIKSIRRRAAVWETENPKEGAHSLWPWQGPRWVRRLCVDKDFGPSAQGPGRERSTVESKDSPKEDERGQKTDTKRLKDDPSYDWKEAGLDREYEAWKRHIDEDPYGAVFGRRLQSNQPTSTFMSWFLYPPEQNSISENPAEAQTTKVESVNSAAPEQETLTKLDQKESYHATVGAHLQETTPESHTVAELRTDEYEYDPISMRNVPKKAAAPVAEHWNTSPDTAVELPVKKFVAKNSETPQNNPETLKQSDTLFSGTAYENHQRVKDLTRGSNASNPTSSQQWLSREGFATNKPALTKQGNEPSDLPARLMPSLDRVNALENLTERERKSESSPKHEEVLEEDPSSRKSNDAHHLEALSEAQGNGHVGQGDNTSWQDPVSSAWSGPSCTHAEMTTQLDGLHGTDTGRNAGTGRDADVDRDVGTARDFEVGSLRTDRPIILPRMKAPFYLSSPEALREEKELRARTLHLQQANTTARDAEIEKSTQALGIAEHFKALYEERFGTIDDWAREMMAEQQDISLKASPRTSGSEAETEAHVNESAQVQPLVDGVRIQRNQSIADIALAISRLELFTTKADIVVHKAYMSSVLRSSNIGGSSDKSARVESVHGATAQTEKVAQSLRKEPQDADTLLAEKTNQHRGPRVRRQEHVFSGRRVHRRGSNHPYTEYETSNPKQSTTSSSSSGFGETMKRILLGGALTAGFCYLVGLTTEVLRGNLEPPKATKRAGMYSTDDAR